MKNAEPPMTYYEKITFANTLISKLKIDERANQKDERFFREIHQEKLQEYLKSERETIEHFIDAWEDAKKNAEIHTSSKIEQMKNCDWKILFRRLHDEYFEGDNIAPFNEERVTQAFQKEFEKRLNALENVLPKILLDEIPDLCVFCLGYQSPTLYEKAKPLKNCLDFIFSSIK